MLKIAVNMICFLAGAGFTWLLLKRRKTIAIQGAIGKSDIVSGQIKPIAKRIDNNTETAIGKFPNLIQFIKDKVFMTGKKKGGPKSKENFKVIQDPYQLMLNEVMEQFNMTIQGAIGKSNIVSGQIKSFTKRIENNTETAIGKFSDLIQFINESIQKTSHVVESIKDKMSIINKKESGPKPQENFKVIHDRYQLMLNEIMEQFNMTIQRKSEDIARLDHIKEGVNQMRPFSKEISSFAFSTKILSFNAAIEAARAGVNGKCFGVVAEEVSRLAEKSNGSAAKIEIELNQIIEFIEATTLDLKTAMDVESRFVNSTIILLQDVVLSVVDSFVRLSEAIDETLGDSSRFRDEVNAIIFNLQFEDICKQMSQHTVQILSSIKEDLQHIGMNKGPDDGRVESETEKILGKVRDLFTMKEEVHIAHTALNIRSPSSVPKGNPGKLSGKKKASFADQDDVLFFDEPEARPAENPETDQVIFFDEPLTDEISAETDSGVSENKSGDRKIAPQDDDNVTFF